MLKLKEELQRRRTAMTTCKLLELQELLVKAIANHDMSIVADALVIVDEEVADITFTDEEKAELNAIIDEFMEGLKEGKLIVNGKEMDIE